MKHFELKAELRSDLGKKATKKVRKDENIPCVLYGGQEVIHFTTSLSAVRKLIYTPAVMFADISLNGKNHVAITKDIQFHPVSDKILHIDFYEVSEEKPLKIKVPITIVGNSPGVKAGGKLTQNIRSLTVKGLMKDIPDNFEVNISTLNIGESLRVKNLASDTLEFLDPKGSVIAMVISARGVVVADEETAEEEGEQAAETASE